MFAEITQAKLIGNSQVPIGQHRCTKAMAGVALSELGRRIGAHGDNLDTACIERLTELFPSPQLGDTVRSPVCAEKLYQQEVAVYVTRVKAAVMFICRSERGNRGTHPDSVSAQHLFADRDR